MPAGHDMTYFLVVLVVGLSTFVSRSVFILTLADRELPDLAITAMRYVAPAVLAALVASLLVGDDGLSGLGPSPETFALAITGLIAWKWKNTLLTLALGMSALWILTALS
ncbi:MAG: AzlD domain-containing protein [Acidimicrobiales bacterium]